MVLCGHSAGAHLAMLVCTQRRHWVPLAPHLTLRGVVGLSGVYSLPRLATNTAARSLLVEPVFGKDPVRWREVRLPQKCTGVCNPSVFVLSVVAMMSEFVCWCGAPLCAIVGQRKECGLLWFPLPPPTPCQMSPVHHVMPGSPLLDLETLLVNASSDYHLHEVPSVSPCMPCFCHAALAPLHSAA